MVQERKLTHKYEEHNDLKRTLHDRKQTEFTNKGIRKAIPYCTPYCRSFISVSEPLKTCLQANYLPFSTLPVEQPSSHRQDRTAKNQYYSGEQLEIVPLRLSLYDYSPQTSGRAISMYCKRWSEINPSLETAIDLI